jgi:hypothetical protein
MVVTIGYGVIGHHHDDLKGARPRARASSGRGNRNLERLTPGLHRRGRRRSGGQPQAVGDDGLGGRPGQITHQRRCAARSVDRHRIGQGGEGLARARSLSQRDSKPPGVRDRDGDRDRDRSALLDRNRVGGRSLRIAEGQIRHRGAGALLLRTSGRVLGHPTRRSVDLEVRLGPGGCEDQGSREACESTQRSVAPCAD